MGMSDTAPATTPREALKAERSKCTEKGSGGPWNLIVYCHNTDYDPCQYHAGVLHGIEVAERLVLERVMEVLEALDDKWANDSQDAYALNTRESDQTRRSITSRRVGLSAGISAIRATFAKMSEGDGASRECHDGVRQ